MAFFGTAAKAGTFRSAESIEEVFGILGTIRLLGGAAPPSPCLPSSERGRLTLSHACARFIVRACVRIRATGPYLIVITGRRRVGRLLGCDVWRVTKTKILPFAKPRLQPGTPGQSGREAAWCQALTDGLRDAERQRDEEYYLSLLQAVLKGNHFYYSTHYDLTHRAQKQHALRDQHQDMLMWERVFVFRIVMMLLASHCARCTCYLRQTIVSSGTAILPKTSLSARCSSSIGTPYSQHC